MTTTPNKKLQFDAYTGMMLGSAIALAIGIFFMWYELERYGGFYTYCWVTSSSTANK